MGEDSTGTPSYYITASVEISKDFTILTCIHAALSMLLHDSLQVCVIIANFSIKVSYDKGHISS